MVSLVRKNKKSEIKKMATSSDKHRPSLPARVLRIRGLGFRKQENCKILELFHLEKG